MTRKFKLKKGDQVVVTTGRDKGRKGQIVRMIPGEERAIVEGLNLVQRHTKQSAKTNGGIIPKEAPIHISNLAYVDPKEGKATRIGYKILEDGRKVRVAKLSGEQIDG